MSIFESGVGGEGITLTHLIYTGENPSDTVGSILCKTQDGLTTGIVVAMPWLLRKASFDTKTIGANTYTWTSTFLRDVSTTEDAWEETIHMEYNSGDEVLVIDNDGLFGDVSNITSYPYVELATNRVWVRSCEEEV